MQEQSLSELLGYGAADRLLIVNCDDLGSSHAANVAIERAIAKGFASSATLMAPCPWAREGAALAANFDVGVHLTLTSEYPLYRWRSLTGARSLGDKDGYLPRTAAEVWANARLVDVEAECRAQIELAQSWGVEVTHLDAHMGTMQTDKRYFEIYLKLADEYRLPLRMVSARHEKQIGFACRSPARERGIVFTDNFIAPTWGKPACATLHDTLANLRPGVSEIFLHPVEDGAELRGYDLENAELRASDYACLMDEQLATLAKTNHVKTISFRPLRDVMRQARPQRS